VAALGWLLNLGFAGSSAAVSYLNTTGVFTVTNITATRTLDVSTASLQNLVDWLGTSIYDIQEDNWDFDNYTITNGSSTKSFDTTSTSLNELLNIIATLVSENPHSDSEQFTADGYTVTNPSNDFVFNCLQTSLNEIALVVGTLLAQQYDLHPGSAEISRLGVATCTVAQLGVGSAEISQQGVGTVTVGA